ncbi:hypothetical protein ACJRO7_020276 [Eucalyptus globulus]|uniref:Uncharacterized protein n=1 Tax=Eucalyptus globulus TaxID=34317 RepID=A0ABD3KHP0_EUCGL
MAAKRLSPTSDVEPDGASASSGFEPEPPTVLGSTEAAPVSTYEKQRLSRIAENKRRMEALGLQNLASSVMGASRKARKGDAKGKRKVGEDDDDDNDSDNEDGDYALAWTAMVAMMMILASSMRRGKRKVSKPKKKPRTKKLTNKLDYVDDDAELAKGLPKNEAGVNLKGRVEKTQENPRMLKRRKTVLGKGGITAHDLAKVADAHDFTWTDEDPGNTLKWGSNVDSGFGSLGIKLSVCDVAYLSMLQLSLDDFSKIVHRCKMIQGSESSCVVENAKSTYCSDQLW